MASPLKKGAFIGYFRTQGGPTLTGRAVQRTAVVSSAKIRLHDSTELLTLNRIIVEGDPWTQTEDGSDWWPHYLIASGSKRHCEKALKSIPSAVKEKMFERKNLIEKEMNETFNMNDETIRTYFERSPSMSSIGSASGESSQEWWKHNLTLVGFSTIDILIYYGSKYLMEHQIVQSLRPSSADIWSKIYVLLNFHLYSLDGVDSPCVYQVMTPDGKIWSYDDMKAKCESEFAIVTASAKAKTGNCVSPSCKECKWKKDTGDISTVTRHIMRVNNVLFYCVPCGTKLAMTSTLRKHAAICPFRTRLISERPTKKKDSSVNSLEKKRKTTKIKISAVKGTNYETRLINWIKKMATNAKTDGHFASVAEEEIINQVKSAHNIQNLVNIFDLSGDNLDSNEYDVDIMNDDFFAFWYGDQIKVQLLDINTKKAVSTHHVENIVESCMEDKKCNLKACPCKGSYTQESRDEFLGHILTNNFLIYCRGCKKGFKEITNFEKHISQFCFIERDKELPAARPQKSKEQPPSSTD